MKRFWELAATDRSADGWQVTLDGKPVRVPGGGKLALPSRPLAEAIAAEWQAGGGAPGGELSYADLPLTRIAGTGQERIAPNPEPVVLELVRYAESDLLCYRAEQPEALAQRQHERWQPLLDWAGQTYGARLRTTAGIVHVPQEPAALAALAAAVARFGPLALAALGVIVPALGSLVLGLAVAAGRLDAPAAHALSILDETFQEETWGWDEEALARRRNVAADLAAAARFIALLRA